MDLNPGPQPGGRRPAPGDLGLVQAFVNSNYDLELEHGAELLHSPAGLRKWLVRRGLIERRARSTMADLHRALAVREGLGALLVAKHEGTKPDPLAIAALSGRITVSLEGDGPRFTRASGNVDGALDLILGVAAAAMLDGSWARLKACRECSWAFYDHSRNGAGNWCSMQVCGGRVKQRAYYRRRTVAGQS